MYTCSQQGVSKSLAVTPPQKQTLPRATSVVLCCRNSLDSLRPYVAFGEEHARGGKGKQPRRPVRLLYRNGEPGSQSRAWPQQLVQLLVAAIYLVFQAS